MNKMSENYYELLVSGEELEALKALAFELGVSAVEELRDGFLIRDEEDLSALEEGLRRFANACGIQASFEVRICANRDWIEEYKRGVKPVLAGKFYIRPSWESPWEKLSKAQKTEHINEAEAKQICAQNGDLSKSNLVFTSGKEGESGEVFDILIDPALAFGSGHHESTNMCLRLISLFAVSQKMSNSNLTNCGGKSAVDVGCGSGILSIALAKAGFAVTACDTDELAVVASVENGKKNGVSFTQVITGSINHEALKNKQFDFVAANIIADIILAISSELKNAVKEGGYLLLSGILSKYKARILECFADEFELVCNLTSGEWESFLFTKVAAK